MPSPTRDATGTVAAMALYAGEPVEAVRQVQPAGQVVREEGRYPLQLERGEEEANQ